MESQFTGRTRQLIDLSGECREIVMNARKDLGDDLGGGSMLDLCADNIEDASLSDIRTALVISGMNYRSELEDLRWQDEALKQRECIRRTEEADAFDRMNPTMSE